ncbi:hypothetical protein ACN95_16190 [Gordonia sihwensis]|nr:hypothetical protein CXX93_17780 [Gordonia sp. YC-JH1]MBY4571554.1 hypothetical protein [Gordonia sihwensis]
MSSETSSADRSEEEAWRRKRRLDAVFGDELPEVRTDPGEDAHSGRGRRWYDENRPPHHN